MKSCAAPLAGVSALGAALVLGVGLSACAPRSGAAIAAGDGAVLPGALALGPRRANAAGPLNHPIEHVVIIVQENRSFDNLFQGFPGANTAPTGKDSKGKTIRLKPIGLEVPYGIDHNADMMFAACDGNPPGENCKMDGFDNETPYGQLIPQNPEYGYVPHRESKLYFDMAQQYVVADDMFTSHIDASFVSHQYIIAGQAHGAVNLPSSLWGCAGGPSDTVPTLNPDRTYGPNELPCFTDPTLGDELDAKGLPWRYYAMGSGDIAYIWSAYQAISGIYNGPDWKKDVISPSSQVLTDIGDGSLAAVTWVTPSFSDSDHSSSQSKTGPDWVASVVNAVGESKFWNDTVVFVMWDEWGGWYDHVPPPYLDYDGLGFRVPLLVISPYAKRGYVSHVQYEHGSILRFVEDTFGLARLAASDTRANSPGPDCLDFSQPPRTFVPFKTNLKPSDFIHAAPDPRAIDEE